MKFLYFTRSNGDIDNMQDNKALTTSAKRKEFIGDEATKFSVQDGVLNPVWDGSKYIKDPDNKESERLLAKHGDDGDRDMAGQGIIGLAIRAGACLFFIYPCVAAFHEFSMVFIAPRFILLKKLAALAS